MSLVVTDNSWCPVDICIRAFTGVYCTVVYAHTDIYILYVQVLDGNLIVTDTVGVL